MSEPLDDKDEFEKISETKVSCTFPGCKDWCIVMHSDEAPLPEQWATWKCEEHDPL